MAALCCPVETPIEYEARISVAQLKSSPIQIWWYRRRQGGDSRDHVQHDVNTHPNEDRSPFPRSWSVNYKGNITDGADKSQLEKSDSCVTDESSVYSTISQEQRLQHELQRDASGYCINHPHIQLAKKRNGTSRFPKILSKNKDDDSQKEWKILQLRCPQCEKDHVQKSKERYQYKPKNDDTQKYTRSTTQYVSFLATVTLIDSHPKLEEGKLALMVRTGPISKEESSIKWNKPDGVIDALLPANSMGGIIKDSNNGNKVAEAQYNIMERMIPIASIDHISRGGDAWDILRQSTGVNDLGCKCDVKIHGFNDRLLRFDVVEFDNGRQQNSQKMAPLRYSFAGVKFHGYHSHLQHSKEQHDAHDDDMETTQSSYAYTTENVIETLNAIVLWDNQRQKTGLSSWLNGITNALEECLSLGAYEVEDENDPHV